MNTVQDTQPKIMRTRPEPHCFVCGGAGQSYYENLRDRLFGVPGEWNLVRCENSQCGLVWLNPMPIEEDIWMAYSNYYTHDSGADRGSGNFIHQLLKLLYRLALRATPIHREREGLRYAFLRDDPPGRVLDVGCGSGERLDALRNKGWEVVGQEIDPKAAEYARRRYGLDVRTGPLQTLKLQGGSFDSIVMNHVIEHVHDPISLLIECRRLLKLGGKLVAICPNIESYSHQVFKKNWRGLEPPRHLYHFSTSTLRRLATISHFDKAQVSTTALHSDGIGLVSARLRQNNPDLYARPTILEKLASLFHMWQCYRTVRENPKLGEDCVLVCEFRAK